MMKSFNELRFEMNRYERVYNIDGMKSIWSEYKTTLRQEMIKLNKINDYRSVGLLRQEAYNFERSMLMLQMDEQTYYELTNQ